MAHRPSGSRDKVEDRYQSDRTNRPRREKDGMELKGLCVNCANRYTCLFPKSEGGVWHCEEYVEEH
jgi:hypothetical protein